MIGLVLSAKTTWITAMETCVNNNHAPYDPGENYEPDEKWTGTVKYDISCGKIFKLFDT